MPQASKTLQYAGNLDVANSHGQKDLIVTLTAAYELTAADSGKTFYLDGSSAGFTVNLPAVASAGSGWRAKFVCKSATNQVVVQEATASDTNIILGSVSESDVSSTDAPINGSGFTNINFTTTAVKGDWVIVCSDGAKYYVTGHAKADGGFTFT